MQAAGLARIRETHRSEVAHLHLRAEAPWQFDTPLEKKFKANKKAWAFFQAQPPYYRKLMTGWVNGAKQEETRLRRLDKLMAACESGRRLWHEEIHASPTTPSSSSR